MTTADRKPIRVLVVDDQQLIRDGIASVLSVEPGLTVTGTAANGREAVERAGDVRPDVVLMDMHMPVMDGVEATSLLRRQVRDCKILALSTFDNDDYVTRALHAGACGYLLKDMPADDLAQAIRTAHAGVSTFSPKVTAKLARALDAGPAAGSEEVPEDDGVELTEREKQVLALIAHGATNREIARELFVTEGTVKNHVSRILHRLGLRHRTQAALYAQQRGLRNTAAATGPPPGPAPSPDA